MISWLINPFRFHVMRLLLVYRYLPALTAHFDVTLIVSQRRAAVKIKSKRLPIFSTASAQSPSHVLLRC